MNDAERGFTLLEMVCVLAIIALLAAVLLPFIPHETSRARFCQRNVMWWDHHTDALRCGL
jgi:prepilin-type N-terminal cleavage/methylation domain-containing protein